MSSTMKVSLLALVSTVVAIPHYGANPHSRFHSSVKVSAAVPTGGWGGYNSTAAAPYPTASGAYSPEDDKTTTLDQTATSTQTLYSTVIVKPSASASGVVAEDAVSSQCGPATITVTESEKITVTVTPGYTPAAQSSAVVPVVESSAAVPVVESSAAAPVVESSAAPVAESSAAPVVESSTVNTPVAEKTTSAAAEYPAKSPVAEITPTPAAESPAETPKAEATTSSKAEVYVAPSYAQNAVSSAAPSASPSAAPSSGNTYTGTKRGLAYNEASLCKSLGSKFGFGYNWGQVSDETELDFIPMMHSPSKSTAEEWLANVDKAVKKGSKAVMGFNECDIAEQCNLSPEAACAAWKSYMNPIKSAHPDVSIIGPSVSNAGAENMGLGWLSKFHDVCADASYDATNIHFYDIYEEGKTLERFQAQVEKAAALYGKKVWVTEFGLNPGSASSEQAITFLKGAMAYLDASDNVQGYSWFMVGTGENQLNSGSGLSAIGEVYASS